MRVVDVKTTIVAIPLVERVEMPTIGTDYAVTNVVVQVQTDEGLVGLGEAVSTVHPDGVELLIKKLARDFLIGHDPFAVEAFVGRVFESTRWQFFRSYANLGVATLETACWDIIGKAAGLPIHKLMGGAVRDRVDNFRWIQRKAVDEMVADARAAVEAGFSVIYVKIGKAPKLDLEMVRRIREAIGPDARLRIDANEAWTPAEAVQRIEELKPYGIDFMEQPVEKHDLDGLAFVRQTTGVPICIDQGAHLQWDIQRALRAGAADYVCTEPCRTGGLLPMKKTAAMIENANAIVCRHVGVEAGISAAAALQVCATIPNLCLGNQSSALMISDDIINEDLRTHVNGTLPVPMGPGLGVTLNEVKLVHYADLYRSGGYLPAPARA
ncbi:MAG: mandelate racemase/muconate lactonizing enzyme family protein [Chloroflexi bacterium]|nr:mandelate racemase/muconate lactonizing enzyme family protein [Chloroflexota bacterium]